MPDTRTIRYYTTLGLIDRPAAMRGRTALYGHRHLMQLVAIKRLQAEGHALADVQVRLTGASDAALRAIAGDVRAATPGAAATVDGRSRHRPRERTCADSAARPH